MNIPGRIKIGAHRVTVQIADSSEIDDSGTFNNYHKKIRLRKEADTPESAVSETFMHEIFEGINAQNNLGVNHTGLTVLSEGLFQVIRDNGLDFREESGEEKIELGGRKC